ncbi:UNVERIFIED_CONTAM: hypothetical protein K2H54_047871 [Gekko kuhli]
MGRRSASPPAIAVPPPESFRTLARPLPPKAVPRDVGGREEGTFAAAAPKAWNLAAPPTQDGRTPGPQRKCLMLPPSTRTPGYPVNGGFRRLRLAPSPH